MTILWTDRLTVEIKICQTLLCFIVQTILDMPEERVEEYEETADDEKSVAEFPDKEFLLHELNKKVEMLSYAALKPVTSISRYMVLWVKLSLFIKSRYLFPQTYFS